VTILGLLPQAFVGERVSPEIKTSKIIAIIAIVSISVVIFLKFKDKEKEEKNFKKKLDEDIGDILKLNGPMNANQIRIKLLKNHFDGIVKKYRGLDLNQVKIVLNEMVRQKSVIKKGYVYFAK
jgi:hypothetical protein